MKQVFFLFLLLFSIQSFGGVVYPVPIAKGGTGVSKVAQFNAIYYGADPTGVANSTTAIQACVTAAQNAGGSCYFPPSSAGYKITSTITVANDVAIEGDSMTASSSAVNGATIFFSGASAVPMFTVDNGGGSFRMSNLSLKNTGSATMAIQLNRVNALIENISSNSGTGFATAVISTHQASSYTYHVTINNVYLANQSISSSTPVGIWYSGGHTLVVNNAMITGYATGIKLDAAGGSGGGIEGVSITNSHIESFCGDNPGYPGSHNAIGISVAGPVYGFNLTGSNFQMNGEQTSCGAAQRAVTLTAVEGANISGNHFLGGSAAYAISIATAAVSGVNIVGNSFFSFGTGAIEELNASADYSIGENDWTTSVTPTLYNSANLLTPSKAMVTTSAAKLATSATSATQLGYLSSATGTTGTTSTNLVFSASPTFSGTLTAAGILVSGLTASQAVFTDGSKNLVSNAITGSGNVVMSASPTFTGTITHAAITGTGSATFASSAGTLTVGSASNLVVPTGSSPNVGVGTTSPNAAGFNSKWGVLSIRGNGTAGQGAGALEIGPAAASSTPGDYVAQMRMYNGANFVGYIQFLVGSNATAGIFRIQTADSSGTMHTGLNIDENGFQNTTSAMESTGAGATLLGANSPAGTVTAPYKWIKQLTSDGTVVYYPVWK